MSQTPADGDQPPAKKAPAKRAPAKKAARSTPRPGPAQGTGRSRRRPAKAAAAGQQTATPAGRPDPFRAGSTAEAGSEQELAAGHEVTENSVGEDSLAAADGDHATGVEHGVAQFATTVGRHRADPVKPAEPAATPPEPSVPAEPASAEDVAKAWQDNRLAQVLYHDWEAGTYDEKWSISFDERCITYARDRFSNLVGPQVLSHEEWPYAKALEIGAGTGFFSLNLKQAGVLGEVHVSDVSAGMVENAQRNARELGFEVTGAVAGAESLPYDDDTFDIVVGHAVIHHIPDVESALREVLRVLKPGGRFVIAGEPTRIGDWYARRLGRITWQATTRVTRLGPLKEKWAKSPEELDASSRAAALESVVDLHTFVPEELRAMAARAGAVEVATQSEELLAAFLGWPVRTFEAAVNPKALGWGWAMFAYKSWQRLSGVDRVLARALPEKVFYNVGITGTKPVRG